MDQTRTDTQNTEYKRLDIKLAKPKLGKKIRSNSKYEPQTRQKIYA